MNRASKFELCIALSSFEFKNTKRFELLVRSLHKKPPGASPRAPTGERFERGVLVNERAALARSLVGFAPVAGGRRQGIVCASQFERTGVRSRCAKRSSCVRYRREKLGSRVRSRCTKRGSCVRYRREKLGSRRRSRVRSRCVRMSEPHHRDCPRKNCQISSPVLMSWQHELCRLPARKIHPGQVCPPPSIV